MVAIRGRVDRRGAIRLSRAAQVALGVQPGCAVVIQPAQHGVALRRAPARHQPRRLRDLPDRHILRRAEDAADVRLALRRLRHPQGAPTDLADLMREFGLD